MDSEDFVLVLFLAVLYFSPNSTMSGMIFGLGSISIALYIDKLVMRNPRQSLWKRVLIYVMENAEDVCHIAAIGLAVLPNTSSIQDVRVLGNVIVAECLYRRIHVVINREIIQPLKRWTRSGKPVAEQTQTDNPIKDIENILLVELNCPVCMENMHPPIYLCVNGHSICHTCKPGLDSCPTCRGSLLNIRNKALENIARHCHVEE
ncbi:uncharacterized protein [Periplaneta americana]|uniref:uncharacterized protein n=1 Tax=Periplaneta americana TaxID=6978 RepID=UPI0037E88568